jgi:hypothetical protein
MFASIVDTDHYEICNGLVVLGNVLYGLIQDSLEITFRKTLLRLSLVAFWLRQLHKHLLPRTV